MLNLNRKRKYTKILIGVLVFLCGLFLYNRNVLAIVGNIDYNPSDGYLSLFSKADSFANLYGGWIDCTRNGKTTYVHFWGSTTKITNEKLEGSKLEHRTDFKYIGHWETGSYNCVAKLLTQNKQNKEEAEAVYVTQLSYTPTPTHCGDWTITGCPDKDKNGNACTVSSRACVKTSDNSDQNNENSAKGTGYYICGSKCVKYNKGDALASNCGTSYYGTENLCNNQINPDRPNSNNTDGNTYDDKTACENNGNYYNTDTSKASKGCYTLDNKYNCETFGFSWSNDTCAKECSAGQYYNTDTSKASKGCYALDNEYNCETFGFCWNNGTCDTTCSGSNKSTLIFNENGGYGMDCTSDTAWDNGLCKGTVSNGTSISFPSTSSSMFSTSTSNYLMGWTTTSCVPGAITPYTDTYTVNGDTTFLACYEEVFNTSKFALNDASADGQSVPCGATLDITTCYKDSSGVQYCKYSAINGDTSKTGTVYRNNIANSSPTSTGVCTESTVVDDDGVEINKTVNDKRYAQEGASVDGQKLSCGAELFITICYKNLSTDQLVCEYNSVNGDTSKTGIVDRYKIGTDKPTNCPTESEDEALTEKKCSYEKQKNISGEYIFEMCYEKDMTDEQVKELIVAEDMIVCKSGTKLNVDGMYASGEVACNDKICKRNYTVNCVNSKAAAPILSVSSAIVGSDGTGNIKVEASSATSEIVAYYVSEIYEVPTLRNEWTSVSSGNFTINSTPGVKYIWVKDANDNISIGVGGAVIDTVNNNTTINKLELYDKDGNIMVPSSPVTYKVDGIVSSSYVRLSNQLNKDSKIAESGFNPFDSEYKLEVSSPTISVYATLTSTDSKYVDGYEPRTVNLKYGVNTILIKIQNNEGKIRTYTILVTRTDDRTADNTLSDMTVSTGDINFNANVTDYKVEIPSNTTSVDVTANISSDLAKFVDGYEPGTVQITGDTTVKLIKVISQTGSTRTYVITFVKEGKDVITDTSLQLFSLDIPGVYVPFEEEVANYSLSVGYSTDTIDINATLKEEGGILIYKTKKKTNDEYVIGSNKGIVLDVGENFVEITVVDKDGDRSYYRLTIIRKEFGLEVSDDVTLKDLKVLGYDDIDFEPNKKEYTVRIKQEKSLVITAVPNSNRSEVFIRGNDELTGFSTVRVKVVAENGEYDTYSIDIKKDAFNKPIEIAAIIAGIVIIGVSSGIIIMKKKNKGRKDYYQE